jgi:hypothetical protein
MTREAELYRRLREKEADDEKPKLARKKVRHLEKRRHATVFIS